MARTSWLGWRPLRGRAARPRGPGEPFSSERLQELDQRALVVVGELRLLVEVRRAEVVTAVDDEVGALAEREQRLGEVREDLAGLRVARVPRERLEIALDREQEVNDLPRVGDPLDRILAL